jgi:hypothetical protein
MDEYNINDVLECADALKIEYRTKDDVEAFNQAVMRLRDAAQHLTIIDSFDDIKEQEE